MTDRLLVFLPQLEVYSSSRLVQDLLSIYFFPKFLVSNKNFILKMVGKYKGGVQSNLKKGTI